jgi:hypothetical protein
MDRETEVASNRASHEMGGRMLDNPTIATRGDRLALRLSRYGGHRGIVENIRVTGINDEGAFAFSVVFDADDLDGAFAELDRRYLEDEAAPYAETWGLIVDRVDAFNRRESRGIHDPVYVDHRPMTTNETRYGEWQREVIATAPDSLARVVAVHRLTDAGAVFTLDGRGTTVDGVAVQVMSIAVFIIEAGRLVRYERYADSALDDALARFEELTRGERPLENTCTRFMAHRKDLMERGEWDRVRSLMSDEFVSENRMAHALIDRTMDAHAEVRASRVAFESGGRTLDDSIVATRGDRLVLRRFVFGGARGEDVSLRVNGLDTDGKFAFQVVFDPEDEDAAYAELDARYVADEGRPHAAVLSLIFRGVDAFNRRDENALASDVVYVDHRPLHAAETDAAVWQRAVVASVPDQVARIIAVHRATAAGAVVTIEGNGRSTDDVAVQVLTTNVYRVSDGQVTHWERYEGRALEVALARFDELTAQQPLLDNQCTRMTRRFDAAARAGDWDAVRSCIAGDGVMENHLRHALDESVIRDVGYVVDAVRALYELADDSAVEFLATRGERLALARTTHRSSAGELKMLHVVGTNAEGLIDTQVVFSDEDVDDAISELDARFVAGEGAPYADVWRAITSLITAFNVHDETDVHVPDHIVDHRLGGFGSGGGASAVVGVREMWALAPDARRTVNKIHAINAHGALCAVMRTGTTTDGVVTEALATSLYVVADGHVSRLEIFSPGDVDAALARFDEITSAPTLENRCTRVVQQRRDAFVAGDWNLARSLMRDDFVSEERDRHSLAPRTSGPDGEVESARAVASLAATEYEVTVVATRGERLALAHLSWGGDRRVETVRLHEIDEHDKLAAQIIFGADELDDAYAELDRRYIDGEGAPHADVWGTIAAALGAFNRRDRVADVVASEYRLVDHLGVGLGSGGRRDQLRAIEELWTLAPDVVQRVTEILAINHNGAVVSLARAGRTTHGATIELRAAIIYLVRGGQLTLAEVFQIEAVAEAMARFAELTRRSLFENAATRVAGLVVRAVRQADASAVDRLISRDLVAEMRQRDALTVRTFGRDEYLTWTRSGPDDESAIARPIAIRGDRLALVHVETRRPGDATPRWEALVLHGLDDAGRYALFIAFDADDLDAAYRELDERYLVGEAAPYAATYRRLIEMNDAFNRRDRSATVPAMTDHRTVGAGSVTAHDWSRFLREVIATTPDAVTRTAAVHRLEHGIALVTLRMTGTTPDGMEIEQEGPWLTDFRNGIRAERFDFDRLDDALSRFNELTSGYQPPQNVATRLGAQLVAAANRRAWGELGDLIADNFVGETRQRNALRLGRADRSTYVAWLQARDDHFVDAEHVVATRGNRLALSAWTTAADEQASWDGLVVRETDGDGRLLRTMLFDTDDEDHAFALLEEWFVMGEAAPYAGVWRAIVRAYEAYNRNDPNVRVLADDFVSVDHHPMGFGVGDRATLLRSMAETATFVHKLRRTVVAVDVVNEHGAVVDLARSGETEHGVELDGGTRHLIMIRDGMWSRMEIFPREEPERAVARFAELCEELDEPLVVRTRRQLADAFERGDWKGIYELFRPDFVIENRVALLGALFGDDNTGLERAAELGATTIDWHTVETRGDRLAIFFWKIHGPGEEFAFEDGRLIVSEVDEDGRLARTIFFDPDDFDAARAAIEDLAP